MAFPDLIRPTGLRRLLAPRLEQNLNGFQGAHIIGESFWTRATGGVNWLSELEFENNANTLGRVDKRLQP